jgi:hypothetical protein
MTHLEQSKETIQGTEATGESGPLKMRKRIHSTTYDLYVYFSKTSRETLKDKIVRLARNEILSQKDDKQ